ncbi:MAG: response regulator transcription factor [Candidatus Korobacteraceae bacterium]
MINIVIADHQAIFRAGIAKILAVEDDLRIVGQPPSMPQLMICLEKLRADVLLISSGYIAALDEPIEVARQHSIPVIVLAENSELAAQFAQPGVKGVVYRSVPGDCMVETVRRVARGETYVQPNGAVGGDPNHDLVGTRVRDRLSEKEIRIMAAVVRGFKNRDIAMQLITSEQVVKNALRNIFDKTGVSDRLELALFVLHHRVLAQATAGVQIESGARRLKRTTLTTIEEETEVNASPVAV